MTGKGRPPPGGRIHRGPADVPRPLDQRPYPARSTTGQEPELRGLALTGQKMPAQPCPYKNGQNAQCPRSQQQTERLPERGEAAGYAARSELGRQPDGSEGGESDNDHQPVGHRSSHHPMASHSSQPAQRPGPCSSVVSSSVDKVGWEGSGTRHDDCRDSANSSQTDIARANGHHSSKPLRSRGSAGNGSSGRRRARASRRIDGAATSAVAAQSNGRVRAASVATARQPTTGTAHRTNCPRGAGVGSAVTFRSLRPGVAVVMAGTSGGYGVFLLATPDTRCPVRNQRSTTPDNSPSAGVADQRPAAIPLRPAREAVLLSRPSQMCCFLGGHYREPSCPGHTRINHADMKSTAQQQDSARLA